MEEIISKIKKLVNENMKKYLPKVSSQELEENGAIYYMNGNNGTFMDWKENKRLSSFMSFYNDKSNLGAIKLMLYDNGDVQILIYDDHGKKFIKEVNTKIDVSKEEMLKLAVTLEKEADGKKIWDANIDKINFNIEVTSDEINSFNKE